MIISPVVVEIDAPRKVVSVSVTNNSDRALTFQADALTWSQVDGADRFEPTDELLVVPPIAKVAPFSSQVFRVALRVPTPSPVERTYRMLLEDVSDDAVTSGDASVSFKFTHNLPVLVAPVGKLSNSVRWKPCVSALAAPDPAVGPRREACVRLINSGNRRVKLQSLTVVGDGWQQIIVLKDGVNVLVGAEREWRVPLVANQIGAVRAVQVQTVQGEKLQATAGGS